MTFGFFTTVGTKDHKRLSAAQRDASKPRHLRRHSRATGLRPHRRRRGSALQHPIHFRHLALKFLDHVTYSWAQCLQVLAQHRKQALLETDPSKLLYHPSPRLDSLRLDSITATTNLDASEPEGDG